MSHRIVQPILLGLSGAIVVCLYLGPALHGAPTRVTPPPVGKGEFEVNGVRLEAAAYIDKQYSGSSRYAIRIESAPAGSLPWELYDPSGFYSDRNDPRENLSLGEIAQTPYRTNQHETTIECELRQYDSLEERVTFHDMDFTEQEGLKFLTLAKSQSVTTPSGVTVTLPAQDYDSFTQKGVFVYNGPSDVMFVKFHIRPGGKRNKLPGSPLYQKYHVPVVIALFAADPVFMNSNSMDSADPVLTLTPPDHKAVHLDSLTIIVRQRAYVQDIPVALRVPVDPEPPQW